MNGFIHKDRELPIGQITKDTRKYYAWRHIIVKCLIFLLGIITGAYLSHYGVLFNDIRIDMPLQACSERFELSNTLNSKGTDDYLIPNIVHYIWFGQNKKMNFIHYLSMLSAYKVQKPDAIFIHCNNLPTGQWWDELNVQVPVIKIVHREPPDNIFGQKLWHKYHQGDVAKLEVLMTYGGIYLDYDVIVLKSFNSLRKYEITQGQERTPKLNAGIIVAHKDALFLKISYQAYKNNYRPFLWDYNCARLPYQLYLRHPGLVHVELFRLSTPDWSELDKLWNGIIDWSELYCIHLMMHFNWNEYSPESIRTINTTFGQVARFVYYGSKELLH